MTVLKPSKMLFLITGVITLPCSGETGLTPLSTIEAAFTNQKSNIQVMQEGAITRVLPDDTTGDRHQRIIIRLANDQTLLVAHNIDLAPRVPNPSIGKTLRFYGEYEWNEEGGVVHWTHKDPDGVHIGGWLEYEGKRYGGDEITNVLTFTSSGRSRPATTLFDIKGRLIGKSPVKATYGFYLIITEDARRGSAGAGRDMTASAFVNVGGGSRRGPMTLDRSSPYTE